MTTQARIGFCLAVLLLFVVVVLSRNHDEQPALAATFVRWDPSGMPVFSLTNRDNSALLCARVDNPLVLLPYPNTFVQNFVLLPRSETQLIIMPALPGRWPPLQEGSVSVTCHPCPSKLREWIDGHLGKAMLDTSRTGFVVTANYPATSTEDAYRGRLRMAY